MVAAVVQFGDALGHDGGAVRLRWWTRTGPQDGGDPLQLVVCGRGPRRDDAGSVLSEPHVRQVLLGVVKISGRTFACTYSAGERAYAGAAVGDSLGYSGHLTYLQRGRS
jgi:hypothetical protein